MTRERRAGEQGSAVDDVPRVARWLAVIVLATLVVPGILAYEFWPLTGWRLFSLSRGETANRWVIEGVYDDGERRLIDLEELPVAYSNAEWPLRSIGGGSERRADAVCGALLSATSEVDQRVVALRIARDAQELTTRDGEWTVAHDLDVRHTCSVEDRP